jgi:hypothetical protein
MDNDKKPQLLYRTLKARARRPRQTPGRRMRAFGANRRRNLLVIPVMVLLIALASLLKAVPAAVNRFRPVDPGRANPLMGWAVDATRDPDRPGPNHSLVYATLTWRELEPRQGEYDFEAFEKKNHLDTWWAMGKRLVLRFVMDVPGPRDHIDIPDWLLEAMGEDAGTRYENELGRGFSPNYSHRTLCLAHEQVLAALGARYNGHSGVAFVEIGSLGHNGSWRTDGVSNEWAMPAAEDLLYWAFQYQQAFDDGKLLMSANFQPARIAGLGLYNEHLGDAAKSWDWLDALEYGSFDYDIGTELRPMPHGLRAARIDPGFDTTDLISLVQQLSQCRPTYVSGLDPSRKTAAMDIFMGYRLWVREARFATRRRAGYRLRVDLDLRNDGVQPFSQPWPVALCLLKEGETVYREITSLDLRTITPGDHKPYLSLGIPRGFRGTYQLALTILDPHTMEGAVALSMDCPCVDAQYILGSFTVF